MVEIGKKNTVDVEEQDTDVSLDVETDSSEESNYMLSAPSVKAHTRSRIPSRSYPEVSSLNLSYSCSDEMKSKTDDPEISESPPTRTTLIEGGRGRIGRLNEPMEFHNYSLVQVDEVVRPVWEIQQFLDIKSTG